MAFSISPKHEEEVQLKGLTSNEFLTLSVEAVKVLKWNIGVIKENGFVSYSGFSFSSYGEEIKITIDGEVAKIKSECTGSQLIDYGKNKNNVKDLISTIEEIKGNFSKEELTTKYIDIQKSFSSTDENLIHDTTLETKSKVSDFLSIFKPTSGYYITPILINLNILVFIIMIATGVNAFMPKNEDLLLWGANFRSVTLDYGWWRLLTCCFLHIGLFHLLMNMYALLYIGVILEPMLGTIRFLSAYLVTGIAASLTSLALSEMTIHAGAFGAIFWMYGVFLAMLTTNLLEKSARKALLTSIAVFVGYNLLNGLKGGVDNAAHLGGLFSGIFVGYLFYPALKDKEASVSEKTSIALICCSVIIAGVIICSIVPNDLPIYEKKLKEFSNLESEALTVYNLPDSTSQASMIRIINNPGITNWKKCVEIIESFKNLDLPAPDKERNKLLKYYSRLRIESYKKLKELIRDTANAPKLQSELEVLNKKIERAIQDIQKMSQ